MPENFIKLYTFKFSIQIYFQQPILISIPFYISFIIAFIRYSNAIIFLVHHFRSFSRFQIGITANQSVSRPRRVTNAQLLAARQQLLDVQDVCQNKPNLTESEINKFRNDVKDIQSKFPPLQSVSSIFFLLSE